MLPGGKAVRYGIGVGREGFEWNGTARIALKREWPVWTPPPAMIRRQPELAKWRGGMPGGPKNALGARALYLFNKGGDTATGCTARRNGARSARRCRRAASG